MPAPDLSSFKVLAGEASSATKFNNLVQAVQDEFGDIDPDQIPGYPSDATKFLRGDGAWAVPAASGVTVYDRATTTVDVVSTVTETPIYSKQIAAGDMSTNKMLRLTLIGDMLFANAGGDSATLRVKFGGTTFINDPITPGAVNGTNRRPWNMNVLVANLAAANSQMIDVNGLVGMEHLTGHPTAGIGTHGYETNKPTPISYGISTLGTIDTTSAQTLEVSIQWSASSANNSWRMRYGVLELV